MPVASSAAAATSPLVTVRAALANLTVGAPNIPVPGRFTVGTAQPSSNWAGWADTNTSGNKYSAVSGNWTQPTVTCIRNTDTEYAVFWVGIDGYSTGSVEQDGTLAVCQNGVISYYSWWEMYPTNSVQIVAAIKPGDKIAASVAFSAGKYKLKVTDSTTTSGSFSTTRACGTCSNGSAEWIAERPSGSGGLFVLPKFGAWKVSAAKVTSGTTTGVISTFPDAQINMVNSTHKVLANTSGLNTAGNAFKVTWKASA